MPQACSRSSGSFVFGTTVSTHLPSLFILTLDGVIANSQSIQTRASHQVFLANRFLALYASSPAVLVSHAAHLATPSLSRSLFHFSHRARSPNQQCFASAITACARALDARSALGLLTNMREDEVPPNDIVLNAVVDACGKVIQTQNVIGFGGFNLTAEETAKRKAM